MGFLYADEGRKTSKARNKPSLPVRVLREKSCTVCPRNKATAFHPKMKASGRGGSCDVFVLGPAPSQAADKDGEFFSDSAGSLLRSLLPSDVTIKWGGIIQCFQDGNPDEAVSIACCHSRIVQDIERAKPDVIMAVGAAPLRWLLQSDLVTSSFHWRGRRVPVKVGEHTCWVLPIRDVVEVIEKARIKKFKARLDEELELERDVEALDAFFDNYSKPELRIPSPADVDVLGTVKQVEKALTRMSGEKYVGVDYESYPLRPYAKDSRLSTAAFATTSEAIAFPLRHINAPWNRRERSILVDMVAEFFAESGVQFIAHNLQMELEWSIHEFGEEALEAVWHDSMSMAYVLDPRKGTLNLNFQSLATLGYPVKSMSPQLNMRQMHVEPLDQVLPYNGLDAIACLDVFLELDSRLEDPGTRAAYGRQVRTTIAYVQMLREGIPVKAEVVKEFNDRLETAEASARTAIQASKQARLFKRSLGRVFDPGVDADLDALFGGLLGRDEIVVERRDKNTKKMVTKKSFDAEVLKAMDDLEISGAILDLRAQEKLLKTYIRPLAGWVFPDGCLHPSVNVNFTSTSRSSWFDPAMQNWPRRQNAWIRAVIEAFKGQSVIACDYGQIEARVIATASGDDHYRNALWTGLDIHYDWALWFLEHVRNYERFVQKQAKTKDETAVIKWARDRVKNKWVFPEFFGASIPSLASYMEITDKDAAAADKAFWREFGGVKEWQERLLSEYRQYGYITMLSGRRVYGPMSKNEVFNYSVQGFASEIQKHAMCEVINEGFLPKLEIHDDLTFFLDKKGLSRSVNRIGEIMCKSPLEAFPMIDVPLTVEVKEGPNWADLEEIKVFSSEDFGHKR
jgi:DNA polymerase I-like protein with 3'-5' exonuclease and polymerase domains/uracil-DNA glycosylase